MVYVINHDTCTKTGKSIVVAPYGHCKFFDGEKGGEIKC